MQLARARHDFSQRRIWITGASSGIGRALALKFAELSSDIILSARDENALNEVATHAQSLHPRHQRPMVLTVDVTNLTSYKAAGKRIEQAGGLDICILNAGKLDFYDIKKFKASVVEDVLNTNFLGMVRGVEVALPLLRKSPYSHLVGMASLASYGGLPGSHGAYCASKAANRVMLDSLRYDLKADNIPVSVICPGFVKTPLSDQNDFNMPMRISAEKAAKYIIKGIASYQYEIDFPTLMSFCVKALAMSPIRFQTWFLQLVYKFSKK